MDMNKKVKCSSCGVVDYPINNLYMVLFCRHCKKLLFKPDWEPEVFICRFCGRGFDQLYPGQSVCDECSNDGVI